MIRRAATLLALALAGCASGPTAHGPARIAPAAPLPLLAPPPPALSWLDAALTPGRWRYRATATGSEAAFGPLVLRCVAGSREVLLARGDARAATALSLTTTYRAQVLAAAAGVARLRASDPALDQLAFSRGRFMVEAAGAPRLVLPAWAEPARVIEDCRAATMPPAP